MQRTRIGPFALEESLDSSGESNILRGLHLERKTSMAVKLLPTSLAQQAMGGGRFAADVKRLQGLVHPDIARCYGGAIEGGQPYLAMELVSGESLRDLLDRRGKLPWEMAVEIVDGVCRALVHAHQHGFVHQRLTPKRILLPQSGGVKLIGFDCAWADRDDVLGLHCPMTVAHYLAPEEFRGRQSASLPPCDLFSVGVVLYECLSGVLPWQAETPADLIQARRAGDAPRVVTQVLDCPVWLDVLVAKLLAVKRADRIATAEEAHRAIVTAKQKVAEGRGAVQQTLSGQKGVFQLSANRDELRKIRQDVRPRNREQSSLFEQTWFLAACLLAIVAGGVWAFLPPSEDQLFSKAQPFMESESPVDWKRAEEQYLKPLLARFPETKYAAEIQAFDDKYTMYRAETRARNNERLGRRAETEAERLYTEAWNFDKKGDRMTAWEKYDALVGLFQKSNDKWDRAFVSLARMRINQFKFNPGEGKSQKDFVAEQLEKAKQLQQSGELVAARGILDDLISSYGENQELQPLVDRARAQMQSLTAP